MLQLSSTPAMLAALAEARDVVVRAYTLHGPVLSALEAAARAGTHVTVYLDADPYDVGKNGLGPENRRLAAALRASGVDAILESGTHAKTIDVDGTLYLDGKNWHPGDLVVSDSADDASHIPMTKSAALREEGALLGSASNADDAIVETESYGRYNPVSEALDAIAHSGASPRLLVNRQVLRGNARERAVLERLVTEGVRVRVTDDTEKFAAVGNRCWVGSANATVAHGEYDLIDWGTRTDDPSIVAAVRARLEARWAAAKSL